jgi:hypothetical protein
MQGSLERLQSQANQTSGHVCPLAEIKILHLVNLVEVMHGLRSVRTVTDPLTPDGWR